MAVDDLYTVSLLHFNGVDGSAVFTDESGKTWNANGNAQIDTAQSKFGGASSLYDGTGDYLTGNGSGDFAFGTGDGAIDLWIRFNATGIARNFIDFRPSATEGDYPVIFVGADNTIKVYLSSAVRINSTTAITTGVWYHVALTKAGSSVRLFINGTQEGGTYTSTGAWLCGASRPAVAIDSGLTNAFNGWIDELRISKGSARWTANFTPPAQEYKGINAFIAFF